MLIVQCVLVLPSISSGGGGVLIRAVGAGILSPYGIPWDQITESYTLNVEFSSAAVEYLVLPDVSIIAFFRVRSAPNFTATPLDGPPIPLPSPAVLMQAPSTVTLEVDPQLSPT